MATGKGCVGTWRARFLFFGHRKCAPGRAPASGRRRGSQLQAQPSPEGGLLPGGCRHGQRHFEGALLPPFRNRPSTSSSSGGTAEYPDLMAFTLSRASGDRVTPCSQVLAMRAKPGLSRPLRSDEAVRRSVSDDVCDKARRRSVRPVRGPHFVAPLRPNTLSFTLRPRTSSIPSSSANRRMSKERVPSRIQAFDIRRSCFVNLRFFWAIATQDWQTNRAPPPAGGGGAGRPPRTTHSLDLRLAD